MNTIGNPIYRFGRFELGLTASLFALTFAGCKGPDFPALTPDGSSSSDSDSDSDSSSISNDTETGDNSNSQSSSSTTTNTKSDSSTDSATESDSDTAETDPDTTLECPDRELDAKLPQTLSLAPGTRNEFTAPCVNRTLNERTLVWRAPKKARYRVLAESTEAADPVLYALDGLCDGIGLACKDDISSNNDRNSAIELDLESGQVVTIVAETNPTNHPLSITLGESLTCDPLEGDLPIKYQGEIREKIGTWYSKVCGGKGGEQGFVFSAKKEGVYSFRTENSDFDTVLYTLAGNCDGDEVFCNNDNDMGDQAAINRVLAKDESITVIVDSANADQMGKFELVVDEVTCPEIEILNDSLDDDSNKSTERHLKGTIEGASDTLLGSCNHYPDVVYTPDQVYSWIVPESGEYYFDTSGSSIDTVLYILNESCTGEELGCSADANKSDRKSDDSGVSALLLNLVKDQKIMIVVENEIAGETGDYMLNIRKND